MNALRLPAFRLYLIANTLSFIGGWVERLALSWIAWESSQSAFWTGVVAVGHIIPSAFLGPVIGALAEQWELRRAAIALNIVLALFSAALFMVVMTLNPPVHVLAAASLLTGVATALNHPVRLIIIAQLVPKEALSSAARYNVTSYNLSRVLGPALAGLLIAAVGAEWSLAANPLSYIPLIWVFATQKLSPVERSDEPAAPLLQSIGQGIRYIRTDRVIAWCMVVTATNAMFTRGILETIPVIVGDLLHGSSTLLATISSSAGGGAIIASLLASAHVPTHHSAQRIAAMATIGGCIVVFILGVLPSAEMAIVAVGVAAFCSTLSAVNSQSLVYGFAQSDFRARTLTWWSTFSLGASAVGGMVLSILAEWATMEQVLMGLSVTGLALGLFQYVRRPITAHQEIIA